MHSLTEQGFDLRYAYLIYSEHTASRSDDVTTRLGFAVSWLMVESTSISNRNRPQE